MQSLLYGKALFTYRLVGKATFLFFLALLHLFFYATYPAKRANLFYSLFTLSLALGYFLEHVFRFMPREGQSFFIIGLICSLIFAQFIVWGLLAVYSHAQQKTGWFFWFVVFCVALYTIMWKWPYEGAYYFFPVFILIGPVDAIRVSLIAVRNKIEGAWVVFSGWLGYFIFWGLFCLFFYNVLPRFPHDIAITLDLAIFCGAVTFSIVLAVEYAQTKQSLKASLLEVEVKRLEAEKMHELDKAKSEFFANISHEFRTPLTLISGTVEKLQSRDESFFERQEEYGLIHRNADRLLHLVNQLLDLSKLEAGKLQVEQQPGEISGFLRRLAGSFASLFETKGITYRFELPDRQLHVLFDPDKVEKVLTNLLLNAFKFTNSGGTVTLSVSISPEDENKSQLLLTVQDTGVGIPEERIQHIFERFYQVDASASRSYEGTGIGLALVKELTELQGGTINVSSAVGVGTSFVVGLPMQVAFPEEVAEPVKLEDEPRIIWSDSLAAGSSLPTTENFLLPRVLVVEDNAELRRFIAGSLAGQYEVLEAENGLLGFEHATDTMPDLIISDVMMPGLDGVTLCRRLKTDERTSHIAVILLTAKADMESRMAGLETGADDYLTKPFQLEELQLRVHNVIKSRQRLRERYSRSLTLQPSEVAVTSVDEKFLQKVLTIMEINLSNCDFDVETFCRGVGMSRAHLHRKLTALTGQSASEFIRVFRLKRAASLLEQQAGNISEVAYGVGFNSLTYFAKCFREQYGQTPSEYAGKGASAPVDK